MKKQDICNFLIGCACGAPRHDYYFKKNDSVSCSILEMAHYGRRHGIQALLRREYPDTDTKNIIVNIIDDRIFVVDGNRHLVALLMVKPDLTFGELQNYRTGLVRIWFAGVEEGKNSAVTPYDVYIPDAVTISNIPKAHKGMDHFKNPPSPINIVPANFRFDSNALTRIDRGYPLYQTTIAVLGNHKFL